MVPAGLEEAGSHDDSQAHCGGGGSESVDAQRRPRLHECLLRGTSINGHFQQPRRILPFLSCWQKFRLSDDFFMHNLQFGSVSSDQVSVGI